MNYFDFTVCTTLNCWRTKDIYFFVVVDHPSPLNLLIEPLNVLLGDCCDFIRQLTLTTFIWLGHSNVQCIGNIFMKQMQLDTISKSMYADLLRVFHNRVTISPSISVFALKFIFLLTTRRTSKATYKPIAQLWTTLIKISPNGKHLVQDVCSSCPDYYFHCYSKFYFFFFFFSAYI